MHRDRVGGKRDGARLLRAFWLAIVLALLLEVLFLAVARLQGAAWEPLRALASAAQRVSWSTLVCVALAWAQVFPPPNVLRGGVFGLLGAPLAAIVARAVHKGVLQAGGAAASAGAPWSLVFLRALEYAWLGVWSTRLAERDLRAARGVRPHVMAGLAVGASGAVAQLALAGAEGGLPPAAGLAVLCANEVLFPLGCALVLFAASVKARRDAASIVENAQSPEREGPPA